MSVALVPLALVARWNSVVNPAPVAPPPAFVTVELKVTGIPIVADSGVIPPAERFGTVDTVAVSESDALPQVTV